MIYCAPWSSWWDHPQQTVCSEIHESHHKLALLTVHFSLHFRLALQIGNIPVPFGSLTVLLVLWGGLGLLALLLGLRQPLLAQLAGQRPGEGQSGTVGHVGELFGTAGGRVGFVDLVEAVIVHLVEAVLQGQDWHEAVAPFDLTADVGAPGLTGHPWKHNRNI